MALNISDDDLRGLVRDAISKHSPTAGPVEGARRAEIAGPHASHGLLSLVKGGDPDGRCLIEPTVMCNHCGYCQSFGH